MDLYSFLNPLSAQIREILALVNIAMEEKDMEEAKKLMDDAKELDKAKKELMNAIHDKKSEKSLSVSTRKILESLGLTKEKSIDLKREMELMGLPAKDIKKDIIEDKPSEMVEIPILKKPVTYIAPKKIDIEEPTIQLERFLGPISNKLESVLKIIDVVIAKGNEEEAKGLLLYAKELMAAKKEIMESADIDMLSDKTKEILHMLGVFLPKKAAVAVKKLISIANYLDKKGLYEDADQIDLTIKRF